MREQTKRQGSSDLLRLWLSKHERDEDEKDATVEAPCVADLADYFHCDLALTKFILLHHWPSRSQE